MNRKIGRELFGAAKDGHIDKLTALLIPASFEDVNYSNAEGWTALMHASRWGRESIVEILLEAGANLDLHNNYGRTALIWAADEGRTYIVQLLLNAGADTDKCDNHGWTALMRAASRGYLEIVRMLVLSGAVISTVDRATGASALDLALRYRHYETQRFLEEI